MSPPGRTVIPLTAGELIRNIRTRVPDLPVLHIGPATRSTLAADVLSLEESFTPDQLLRTVESLIVAHN